MNDGKQKYHVKITKKAGAQPDSSKHKDFKSVYNKYTNKYYRYPWSRFQFHEPKNRKIVMWVIVALAVIAAMFWEFF